MAAVAAAASAAAMASASPAALATSRAWAALRAASSSAAFLAAASAAAWAAASSAAFLSCSALSTLLTTLKTPNTFFSPLSASVDLAVSADATTAATSLALSAVLNIAFMVSCPSSVTASAPSDDLLSDANASLATSITFFRLVALSGLLKTASIFSEFLAPISSASPRIASRSPDWSELSAKAAILEESLRPNDSDSSVTSTTFPKLETRSLTNVVSSLSESLLLLPARRSAFF